MCKISKLEENFRWRNKAKGRRTARCKDCLKISHREYWKRTEQGVVNRKRSNYIKGKERVARNAQFVWDYLLQNPCIDCGENDPVVLEFDHREPCTKVKAVSEMVRSAFSIDNLKSEIEKCDVRCVKCHRYRTAKQFGWYCNIDRRKTNAGVAQG